MDHHMNMNSRKTHSSHELGSNMMHHNQSSNSNNNINSNSNNNNNNNNGYDDPMMTDENTAYKRAAYAGQWRTPPLPIFANSANSNNNNNNAGGGGMMMMDGTSTGHNSSNNNMNNMNNNMNNMNNNMNNNMSSSMNNMNNSMNNMNNSGMPPPAAPAAASSGNVLQHTMPSLEKLPASTEDYVKALQEAYLRGAEAAAAMAKQQQHQQHPPSTVSSSSSQAQLMPQTASAPMPPPQQAPAPPPLPSHLLSSAVSCPNLLGSSSAGSSNSGPILPLPVPNPLVGGGVSASSSISSSTTSSMPPPPPVVVSGQGQAPNFNAPSQLAALQPQPLSQQQQQQPPTYHHHPHLAPSPIAPTSSQSQPMLHVAVPPQAQQTQPPQAQQPSQLHPVAVQHHHHPQQRSMSLPDMSAYASQQQEEVKRQKRLARNRASARLRRLRKKNLVDAYETEVGLLEKTLQKLKAHQWGGAPNAAATDDSVALTDALSMDRGQQELTATERQQAAADILQQQLLYVQQLEELMQEQYVLYHVDQYPDLAQTLQLSEQQRAELRSSAASWQDEWTALQTVKESLQAMKENEWLWNEGVCAMAEQFMSILHKNQISKFMLWADHNVEGLEEIDIVNAPGNPPAGPVFHFGVDSVPEERAGDNMDVPPASAAAARG